MTQRYSNFSLPQSKYKPGQTPRSVKELSKTWLESLKHTGHLGELSWRQSTQYLYAIDLFNTGFWWEAHEVLEGLWVEQGRKGDIALFLQGLIQIAAALLKKSLSVPRGARSLSLKGLPKIAKEKDVFLGIEILPFWDAVENYISDRSAEVPRIKLTF